MAITRTSSLAARAGRAAAFVGTLALLAAPAAASAGGDVDGTWVGGVRVAGLDRVLALQLHCRRSGEVYGYALGASPGLTVRQGRLAAGRLTLRLDFDEAGGPHLVEIDALLAGPVLDGVAREGATSRPLRLVRRAATEPIEERRLALAVAGADDSEPITELVVALDSDGALVTGSYASSPGCGVLGCDGTITAFRESGGVLDVHLEPAGGCAPGTRVHATFDPATGFYAGSYALPSCAGTGGALIGARGIRARSDDLASMLAVLGRLADDLEERRAPTAPYPPFASGYLHAGTTLDERLAELAAQVAGHDELVVTFDRFRNANTVDDPTTLAPLDAAPGLQFHDRRSGRPLGGGDWVVLRDADMSTLLDHELRFFLRQKDGWAIAGDQLPELDLPFAYEVGRTHLKTPTPAGAVYVSIGPWGAHVSPHTGHAFGDPKVNFGGLLAVDESGLVELEGNGNGVREAGEVWGYDGGPGGSRVRDRAPLYRAPYAGTVVRVQLETTPSGVYFDDPPQWQVEVLLANGMLLVLQHVARLAPPLRDALLAATGIDSDTYAGPPADLLAGNGLPVAAHTPLAHPQLFATPVPGHPGFYRGGGGFPDLPWAQMEFRYEGPVDGKGGSICELAHLRPERRAKLQAVLDRDIADPRSPRYTVPHAPRRWVWAAESSLCLAYSTYPRGHESLHTQLGGWWERESPGTTADELFAIFPIARESRSYDPGLYSSPSVTHLVVRRRRHGIGAFAWTLPGGAVARPFYPHGEVLEETPASLLVVWRDLVAAGDAWYQRAAYRLDAEGLEVKWGALAASAASAASPTLGPGEACDDAAVLCYDHRHRPGF